MLILEDKRSNFLIGRSKKEKKMRKIDLYFFLRLKSERQKG